VGDTLAEVTASEGRPTDYDSSSRAHAGRVAILDRTTSYIKREFYLSQAKREDHHAYLTTGPGRQI